MEDPRGKAVARVAAAFTVTFVAAAGIAGWMLDTRFTSAGHPEFRKAAGAGFVFVAAIVASAVVGVILLVRRPRHPVGWLFAAFAICIATDGLLESYGVYGLIVRPGSLPAAGPVAAVSSSMFITWLVLIALVCSLTPDGHHLSPRWRMASIVMAGSGAMWFVLGVISPGPLKAPFTGIDNSMGIEGLDVSAVRLLV